MRRPRRSCGDWEWVRRAGDAPELAVRSLNLEGGASGNGSLGGRGEGRAGAREVGLARGHGGHGADGGGGESSHLNRCKVLYCVCRYEVRRAAPDAFTSGLEKQLPVLQNKRSHWSRAKCPILYLDPRFYMGFLESPG